MLHLWTFGQTIDAGLGENRVIPCILNSKAACHAWRAYLANTLKYYTVISIAENFGEHYIWLSSHQNTLNLTIMSAST